jgi:hypothetical protein
LIGLFDLNAITNYNDCSNQIGELLVATGVWDGTQNDIVSIGSVDNCAFLGTQLSGYVAGNPVVVRVYRPSTGLEYTTNLTFGLGTGTFGDIIQSITEVTLGDVIGGGDISGCLDAEACNYNANATEDNSSCEYAEENYDCDGNFEFYREGYMLLVDGIIDSDLLESIGTTDALGYLEYNNKVSFPILYDTPDMGHMDEMGNVLGTFNLENITTGDTKLILEYDSPFELGLVSPVVIFSRLNVPNTFPISSMCPISGVSYNIGKETLLLYSRYPKASVVPIDSSRSLSIIPSTKSMYPSR